MTALRRARLAVVLALVSAIAVIGFEFPFGELFSQRSQLRLLDAQLAAIGGRNASLRADIAALSAPQTVAAIAHEEYGLIRPGQRSYVILPAVGEGTSGVLAAPTIPPQDLVAAPPGSSGVVGPAARVVPEPGFWSRFADRLAFWRWAL